MDLRYEFDRILAQYGYPILLVRTDAQLRCSCWNEKTQEADRECPFCFGMGWTVVVEKHMVRDVDISASDMETSIGPLTVAGRAYFMRYNASVSPSCLIVEVDWSPSGKPIYNDGGIYEVSYVYPYRYKQGQIVYQKVYTNDTPIQKRIRGIRIANVNGIVNYEIAMER